MPEQVVIEFVGDASQLQPAVDSIEKLTGTGTKLNQEFVKTTTVFNNTSKSANVAHISIDQMSQSVRDLNKNVLGNEAQQKVKELATQFTSSATESKKLTTELRDLKDQLSRLAQSGQANTAEFQKLQTQAAKVQDTINKTNKSIQILSTSGGAIKALTSVVTGLAGGFALAQGAAALFGDKSKDLEKTLLKVQAVMLILNGVMSIQNTLEEAAAIKTALYGTALKVVTAIQNAFAISAEAAWAVATGGITLLIGAVTTAILFFRQGTDEAISSTDKLKSSLDELSSSFDKIEIRAGNVAAVNKRVLQDQEDLIQRLIDTNASAGAIYSAQLKLVELKKKANADELAAEEKKLKNLQDQQSALIAVIFRSGEFAQATQEDVDKAQKSYDDLAKQVANVKNRIFELTNNTQDFITQATAASKQLKDSQIKDAEDLAKELERQRLLRLEQDRLLNLALTEAEIAAFKNRNKSLDELYKEDVDNFSAAIDKKLTAQTVALDKELKAEKKTREENYANAANLTNALKGLGDSLFQYNLSVNQNEIDALEDKHRRGLLSDKAYNKAIAEARHKQAKAEKEKAAFDIIIQTAVGIIRALADQNFAQALIIGVAGGVELAAVLARKIPDVPEFAKGTKKAPPGMKLVGEKGPELIPDTDKGGYPIIPNKETREILAKWDMPSLDVYPDTPYISDATMTSMEKGRSPHTAIDYDLLADKLSQRIARHPRLTVNIDENGFEKRIIEGANKRKSLDESYSWKG